MFPFRKSSSIPVLPKGFVLEAELAPSPDALNTLLSQCNQKTYPPQRLSLAIARSVCYLSILEEKNGKLVGFVRATSDMGLNANLWNLVAKPGEDQCKLLAVLVYQALQILRKNVPGCSVSVSAPSMAINALQNEGFLLDPGGIRVMGFRLR